ncbi:hypothetical protein [Yoonia sp. R2-816]|uniref:hypothetical protein n=1 Tax=Yoonia sp. R2-816 TaxID=3342638 RepID=UPI003728062E
MPDQTGPSATDTPLEKTLQALIPDLKAKRRLGWAVAVVVAVTTFGLTALLLLGVFKGDLPWIIVLPMIGVFSVIEINRRVARSQQALILPHLAKTVDLTYTSNAKTFLDALPERLLPRARSRKAGDWISGTVGGRPMDMAEVKIETGGKNSRTLFRGLVLHFQNAVPMPAFFLAVERQTKGWLMFSGWIKVNDLVRVDTITGRSGENYGIWLSRTGASQQQHPALQAVLDVLTNLETRIGSDARLFSATSTGEEMHIALAHKRDLFHFGGLFASQDKITSGIRDAFDDLNVPLRIVSALLDAEAQADKVVTGQQA